MGSSVDCSLMHDLLETKQMSCYTGTILDSGEPSILGIRMGPTIRRYSSLTSIFQAHVHYRAGLYPCFEHGTQYGPRVKHGTWSGG